MMFGDGPNDMEIFDYVGLKIAMGNAVPELKEKADFVTKTVEEDGILYALEELGLVEKQLNFPQVDLSTVEGPVATIKTNHGDMKIKLFPDHAPKTVANFVALSKDGYYDGIIFHRIIPEFMIQGGDPTGTGMGDNLSMAIALKMNSQKNFTMFVELFQWQMLVQIQTEASSLSFKIAKFHTLKKN